MAADPLEVGDGTEEFLSVNESRTAMDTEEEAAAAFAVVTALFDERGDISFVGEGEIHPGTMVRNGPVDVGDDGRSYTMASSADGVLITTDVVVARTGRVLVFVMYTGVGAADPDTTAGLARLAVRQVETEPVDAVVSP